MEAECVGMTRSEAIKFLVIRSLGNFLLLFALYGVGATFGPVLIYEAAFRINQVRGVHFIVQREGEQHLFNNLVADKGQILLAKDTQFGLVIPKIAANAKVIPNVDPTSPAVFLPALERGVAHAKGSVFPGMPGNTYLFSHSTDSWWNVGRYNAVFYLLKDLSVGDDIVVFFEGQRYNYVVSESRISDSTDTSLLTDTQTGPERLILQTCWPPGTTWKRLYVIAKPK